VGLAQERRLTAIFGRLKKSAQINAEQQKAASYSGLVRSRNQEEKRKK